MINAFLANTGISSFNRGRIGVAGQGLVLPDLHHAPPTSHLSSTLIIIHYSIFISHPQAAESSVCNGQLVRGGEFCSTQNLVKKTRRDEFVTQGAQKSQFLFVPPVLFVVPSPSFRQIAGTRQDCELN